MTGRIKLLVIYLLTFGLSDCLSLSPVYYQCSRDKTECIGREVRRILAAWQSNDPEVGLPPLDPLFLEDASPNIFTGGKDQYFHLKNATITGLSHLKIRSLRIAAKIKTVYASVSCNLHITGTYSLYGSFLLEGSYAFLMKGSGKASIHLQAVRTHLKLQWHLTRNKGNLVLQLLKDKCNTKIGKSNIQLNNLIYGGLGLDDVNEHWKDFLKNDDRTTFQTVPNMLLTHINNYLKSIPYSDLMLQTSNVENPLMPSTVTSLPRNIAESSTISPTREISTEYSEAIRFYRKNTEDPLFNKETVESTSYRFYSDITSESLIEADTSPPTSKYIISTNTEPSLLQDESDNSMMSKHIENLYKKYKSDFTSVLDSLLTEQNNTVNVATTSLIPFKNITSKVKVLQGGNETGRVQENLPQSKQTHSKQLVKPVLTYERVNVNISWVV